MFARYLYVHLMSGWCNLHIRISLLILFGVCECVLMCECLMMIFTKFSYAFWFQLQDLYFKPEKALAFLFVASP